MCNICKFICVYCFDACINRYCPWCKPEVILEDKIEIVPDSLCALSVIDLGDSSSPAENSFLEDSSSEDSSSEDSSPEDGPSEDSYEKISNVSDEVIIVP